MPPGCRQPSGCPADLGYRNGPLVLAAGAFDVEVEALSREVAEAANRSGYGSPHENRIRTMGKLAERKILLPAQTRR
jgi:hypothetical protein